MPHVVGVIPARYASQRLPGKPLVDLLGKPMIQRVYEQSVKATLLDQVIVATDDRRIADAVRSFGGEAVMTSADITSGSDRVAAVARQAQGDVFVNVQGDEPLIAPEMIDEAIRVVLDDRNAGIGTLAKKIESPEDLVNPSVVKVVFGTDSYALYFSRSPIPFVRDVIDRARWLDHQSFFKHIGIYVFRRESILQYGQLPESSLERAERLEQLRILEYGFRIKVGFTRYDSIPVDTERDVERILSMLR
ncbi:MAG: 3-deoxy-manno-octulosonate cytidylyltransferase [Ignavibacteria bacterium]|nr:3-deoxy-manno-octulosonate cytidylyltransferase [Ignavibacteria bacterium]